MKILIVINRIMRSGGAEKFILDLLLALHKLNGIEVEALSISPPENNDFLEILEKNGIKHHVLSGKLRSVANIKKFRNFIKVGGYDAVHVNLFPALYYASIAKRMSDSSWRLIYTEHSTSNNRRGKKLWQLIDRQIYRRYDEIVAISDKVKENLAHHLGTSKISIINNGINMDSISSTPLTDIREELNIDNSAKLITMVSRVTPGKDFKTLIGAIEKLPTDFHAIFVGDGPLMSELQECKDNSSAKPRIHVLGMRKDVIGILKASDIVVLSTHHEGFSIAMLEAMSCHKPFVASAVEGIVDLVADVAVLFDYQDVDKLADILLQLASDEDYYSSVAERCYEFASCYDINRIAEKYLERYQAHSIC